MKVLLAIDGSGFSDAAVEECCDLLSTRRDAEIHVLTVIEPSIITADPLGVFPSYVGEVDEVFRHTAEKVASAANARILERLPSIAGGLTSRIAVGNPKEIILDEAQHCGADIVVVGSRGSGFLGGAPLGSVSNAVLHHSPCSVLVVRRPRDNNGGFHNAHERANTREGWVR